MPLSLPGIFPTVQNSFRPSCLAYGYVFHRLPKFPAVLALGLHFVSANT